MVVVVVVDRWCPLSKDHGLREVRRGGGGEVEEEEEEQWMRRRRKVCVH